MPEGRRAQQAGVLDVGCHSVLLTVAEGRRGGGTLEEVLSRKVRLRLHETLDAKGRLGKSGVRSVQLAVAETLAVSREEPLPEVYAFATSVIRDAPNRDEILAQVARATGTRLRVLSGEEEARLAYVAARRWAGGQKGALLMLDIGGGTVEIASGTAEQPRTVLSLPLGARTITREWKLGEAVSSARRLAEVRRHLRRYLAAVPDLPRAERGGRVLACSKTFTQLARYSAARRDRSRAPQVLTLREVRASVAVLAGKGAAGRGRLPGISRHRAAQSLAGALVAEALMEACRVDSVEISPWSTREGLLLERLAAVPGPKHRHSPRRAG